MDARHGDYSQLPIPTYEEAMSSRPASSQNHRGPGEISDDAERQGLLGSSSYRPPTVESPRSSIDSDLGLPEMSNDREARRHIEELDYLDPSDEMTPRPGSGLYHRARLRSNLSKHLANLSATFSSLRIPSIRSLYSTVPPADDTSNSTSDRGNRPPPVPPWWTRPSRFSVPEQYRMSGATFARLCGLFLISLMVYVLFAYDMFPGHDRRFGRQIDPEAVRSFVQSNLNGDNIADYLRYITSYDHVAGTEGDLFLARWMEEQWLANGGFDEVAMLEYYVYLNYPTAGGRSVQITAPKDKKWTAKLEEEAVSPDKKQTLAWHGHSKSGEATGPLVYANGGSREDFAWLRAHGVETNGTIALVRYYSTQGDRALKIKAAEDAGCAGVLIYSDPFDDGYAKGPVWPDGRWRPDDSLQRGGVSLMSWVVGDPLTPGWPSTKGAQRVGKERSRGLVQIPSLPLAWRDAKVLIDALQGHGVEVPDEWVGGTSDATWFTGSGAKTAQAEALPEVHLKNMNDENERQRIWNVHGLIQGLEQPEKKIIIGNHRDAWCFGSVDPGSGSAIMMEVINILGALRNIGWKPLRTIEFVSWDAEEYNLVGSTEYVEDKVDYLREHGVAYLNVDVGVYGSSFRAAGSPVWEKPLLHVLNRVADPGSNGTLKQTWDKYNKHLAALGAGSDYVAFQDIAGMSSIDFGFEGVDYSYPYHSCYETFEWMEQFGDPGFTYHHTLAQVWALLILELSDRPLIPFDLNTYVSSIKQYTQTLQRDAQTINSKRDPDDVLRPDLLGSLPRGFNLAPLHKAVEKLEKNVAHFHRFEELWTASVLSTGGLETMEFAMQRFNYNERVTQFESNLLDLPHGPNERGPHGLPGREQFKHILFAPQVWSGYEEAVFPGVRDAMEVGDWKAAQMQVAKAAKIIERAGDQLVANLRW